MNRLGPTIDALDPGDLLATLGLLGMGLGVMFVLSVGWALIIMSTIVLGYVVLPDQKAPE